MFDVSAKLVDIAIEQFQVSGLDPARLAQGLALPGLTNRAAFADRLAHARIVARARRAPKVAHRGASGAGAHFFSGRT